MARRWRSSEDGLDNFSEFAVLRFSGSQKRSLGIYGGTANVGCWSRMPDSDDKSHEVAGDVHH